MTTVASIGKQKKTIYRVTFNWGGDNYYSNHEGVTCVNINVTGVDNKFDALKQAWDRVRELVDNVEPAKMNVETKEVCD